MCGSQSSFRQKVTKGYRSFKHCTVERTVLSLKFLTNRIDPLWANLCVWKATIGFNFGIVLLLDSTRPFVVDLMPR